MASGTQAPSPAQADQSDHTPLLHVRDWVPQLPQARVDGPAQLSPPHAPHAHEAEHVCMPPVPHAWIAPGAQTPSPVHAVQAPHTPFSHVRD
jgi:hypothetical protein